VSKNSKALLIVNEETTYADYLKRNIEGDFPSLSITVTDSGENALKLVKEHDFALIIADLILPGMGGINLFFEIKELFPDLEVILLSHYLNKKITKVLKKEGLFGFLEKPFLMESLSELIERGLNRE
jgi:two-component system C4-dicarboxylate transport response regulator DctD